jgi:hypothetical protein
VGGEDLEPGDLAVPPPLDHPELLSLPIDAGPPATASAPAPAG